MQAFINKNNTRIVSLVLSSCFSFSMYAEQALSNGGETTQSNSTTDSSVVSPSTQNTGSPSITPTTFVQTGSANINPSSGGLAYPNCSGTCFFGIVRASSSSNNFNSGSNPSSGQIEALVGFVQSLGTSEQVIAEANRTLVEIQRKKSENEINIDLALKLSDALEAGRDERANILAILLAPRLGKTHLQLLSEMRPKTQSKPLKDLAEVRSKPQSKPLKNLTELSIKPQPKLQPKLQTKPQPKIKPKPLKNKK